MDINASYTLRELMLMATTKSDQIRFRWMFSDGHQERRQIVEDAIDYIATEFAETYASEEGRLAKK